MPREADTEPPRTERVFSAGGLVYRTVDGAMEVVICGRSDEGIWGLPKGTPDGGETVEQTAMREVREETGLEVEIEDDLGSITYWFRRPGVRFHKTVYHYLMRPIGGDTSQHDHEYDQVEWTSAHEAIRRLSYPNERMVVETALARVSGNR
ncbi:MAG: NUDIX domain-containing protein [Dehalococcoidia bacterium]|nr:NUDIX domain-containing protein [Dehalococcoidia bacterium]